MAYDGLWRPRMAKDGHTPYAMVVHTPYAYDGLWRPMMTKDGQGWPMMAYEGLWPKMNACQMDRESHLQDDVRSVQILQRMQCTNECNEHDAHDAKTKWCTTRKWSKTIATIATAKDLPLILWIWDRCCDLKRAFKTPKRTLKILKSDDSLERLCHELLERRRRGGESTGRYLLELITCLFWRLTVYEK